MKASSALRRSLDAGVDPNLITFTSDGQASLPDFGPEGEFRGLQLGKVDSLFKAVREAILESRYQVHTQFGNNSELN